MSATARHSPIRRWGIAVTALLLLLVSAIVLPPLINANRLRGRLAAGLSAELGRPVRMDSVRVRLLPRPGFEIENLEVAEQPEFGNEPVLRAANVTAAVRFLPLWRGRVEVATIAMREVSLNISRNAAGRWNFENILERTSQLPAAARGARPTGTAGAKRTAGAGPQFPYLEVTDGRVNFKRGVEKLPLSFTNAQFALWLETPNEWRLRLRAEPVRTDLNAPYTGEVRVEGSVLRANPPEGGLMASGIDMSGEWRDAPLGQLWRLFSGADPGWRGETRLQIAVKGTIGDAEGTAQLQMAGLRRDDFVPTVPLDLNVQCAAHISLPARNLDNAACRMPASGGQLSAFGSAGYALGQLQISGGMQATQVGAGWALDAVRVVRQGISPALAASGNLNGKFSYDNSASPGSHLAGSLQWSQGSLNAPSLATPLLLPAVALQSADTVDAVSPVKKARTERAVAATSANTFAGMPLTLLPVKLTLGAPQPLIVRGGFSKQGYVLQCDGAAELGRLASLMRLLGFARWEVLREVKGKAVVHAALRDAWMRDTVSPPSSEGTMTLTDVSAQTAWLPGVVALKNAELLMARGAMRWQNVDAIWANTRLTGSADKIETCEEGECGWRVAAHTAELDMTAMRRAYSESGPEKLLELFRGNAAVGWPEIHMDLTADTLKAGLLTLKHFDTAAVINGGTVKVVRLDGQLLGGTLQGTGNIQMGTGTTVLSLGLNAISVEDAGAIFHERWGGGTAESSLGLILHGLDGKSATGEFTAMVRNGSLVAPSAESTPLAKFDSWQMAGTISSGRVFVERSVLAKGAATSTATGSITFGRAMDWAVTKWQDNSEAASKADKLSVRGELGQPVPGLQAEK